VVVQTYAPDHFAILAAARHDYTTFYEQEIVFRAEAGYPPFTQLLRLVYSDVSDEACRAAAEGLAVQLRGALALVRHGEVIGPAPCFIGKIAGRYLWQVLVRADDVHPLLPLIPPGWTRDVDPMSLL
jgi:primosomal protein N' (replication factor Y)